MYKTYTIIIFKKTIHKHSHTHTQSIQANTTETNCMVTSVNYSTIYMIKKTNKYICK